jgi:His-Xaa-Ser system protein HxsD
MSTALSVDVDTTLYSSSAVMRAAYKFSGHFFVGVVRHSERSERLVVTFRQRVSGGIDVPSVIDAFNTELVDQQLRERLEAEFGPLRELIVAQAFSDTSLLADEQEADPAVDPLAIADDSPGPHVENVSASLGNSAGAVVPLPDA